MRAFVELYINGSDRVEVWLPEGALSLQGGVRSTSLFGWPYETLAVQSRGGTKRHAEIIDNFCAALTEKIGSAAAIEWRVTPEFSAAGIRARFALYETFPPAAGPGIAKELYANMVAV